MTIDIDRIGDLLEQADRWIKEGAKPMELTLGLRWDGRPDSFTVDYDADRAGLLTLAISSDPVLAAAAWAALLKVISEYGDIRMGMVLREFAGDCGSIHRKLAEDGMCGEDAPLMFVRHGKDN